MELRLVTAVRTQAQKILARWGYISLTNVSKAGTDHFNQGPTVLNVGLLSCDSKRPLSALLIACFLALTTMQLIETQRRALWENVSYQGLSSSGSQMSFPSICV
ncbi:hypothetical protein HETIRDRAFT_421959 [Heterobasidion irregulare TC 32-1]|uniref:Uncharacterized protein n=1 Tax=Heterobasidion irregulare (strain TC 32-1) TaxID=747525 RepID=W4JST3_HETIT|nr:uncharacterized protein HETIRDRAFT_421959 [Heterobasidion irregulare TC 32-1]ETW76514.1 hypothetical protein HETIRDRAFT_421959 [Heterobasidion irregulare TC 32-1]